VLVVLIIFVVAATLIPRFGQTLGHARVNRAANVVAANFFLAQSLAARQHAPVTVQISSTDLALTIVDATSGDTLRTQAFDAGSDLRLAAFSASPSSVEVLPNGTTSQTIVVTVGGTDYYHQVTMTRAGQVRITQ
jgi:type II secretory pathway pseudopilin PulG